MADGTDGPFQAPARYELVGSGSIMRTFRCRPCDRAVPETMIAIHDAVAHPTSGGPAVGTTEDVTEGHGQHT